MKKVENRCYKGTTYSLKIVKFNFPVELAPGQLFPELCNQFGENDESKEIQTLLILEKHLPILLLLELKSKKLEQYLCMNFPYFKG